MTKYVLLKQVVARTFDHGFRCNGYEPIEFVETDGPNEILDSEPLKKLLDKPSKKKRKKSE